MLTLKQLLVIETHSFTFPLRASSLLEKFPGLARPLSMRAVEAAVQAQKVYLCLELRDSSILQYAGNPAQFVAAWKTTQPSHATLVNFVNQLSSVGGVIKHLSPSWQSMVISGTPETIANFRINILQRDAATGAFQVVGGTALILGGMAAIATGTPPGIGAGLFGVVSGAGTVSYGWYQIWNANQPTEIPEVTIVGGNPNDIPEVEIIGQLPDNLVPDDVLTLPPVEMDEIPPDPPDPPDDDDDDDEDDDFDD
jgi:hypothetical protein